jgi:hypothetical protein
MAGRRREGGQWETGESAGDDGRCGDGATGGDAVRIDVRMDKTRRCGDWACGGDKEGEKREKKKEKVKGKSKRKKERKIGGKGK